ncbi:hypothetical protein WEH80_38540 [Actinomycetes bacterium KLBMP 9759]
MSEPGQHYMHPLLRVQVEEWRRQAGVDSATPNAPVVDDRRGPSRWSRMLRWWRSRVRRPSCPRRDEAVLDPAVR